MGFIAVLILVLVFAGVIFLSIKMSNLKYRARQQVLKNTGISSSDISAGINNSIEKKNMQRFLEEHKDFTEESIKDLLKKYTTDLIQKNPIVEFSQDVSEKIQEDSKLDKLQAMQFVRVNVNHYSNSKLNAIVVYTDNRDEYNIYLYCTISEETIQLDKYQIAKGAVVGF